MNQNSKRLTRAVSVFLVICICVTFLIVPTYAEKTEKSKGSDSSAIAEVILGNNVEKRGVTSVVMGTDKTVTVNKESGREGWLLQSSSLAHATILIDLSDNVVKNVEDGSLFRVEVDYLDSNNGVLGVGYDSRVRTNQETDLTYVEHTKEWKTTVYYIDDAYFGNRLEDGYDLKVDVRGDRIDASRGDVTVAAIRVYREVGKYPIQVESIDSDVLGNNFGNGEAKDFTYSLINHTASDRNVLVNYEALDISETVVWSKSEELTVPSDGIKNHEIKNVVADKYGLYYIRVTVSDPGFSHTMTRRFAYINNRTDGKKNRKFGFVEGFIDLRANIEEECEAITKAGAGMVRGNPGRWRDIDTGLKLFNYKVTDRTDEILSAIAKYDLDTVATIGLYPAQNKYGPNMTSDVDMPISELELQGYEGYCKFMAEKLAEYGVNVTAYELWNEIDIPGFNRNGNMDKAGIMAERGAKAIKQIDPNAQVGLSVCMPPNNTEVPNFSEDNTQEWRKYATALTVHVYYPEYRTEEGGQKQRIEDFKEIYRNKVGIEPTSIHNTEYGRSAAARVSKDYRSVAKYTARDLLYYLSSGDFDSVSWYDITRRGNIGDYSEDTYGVLQMPEDYKADTPYAATEAYVAITNYNTLMMDTKIAEKLVDGEDDKYAYRCDKTDGSGAVMGIWTKDQTDVISFKSSAKELTVYDMYGNAEKVYGKNGVYSFVVSGEPQYVEGDLSDVEMCDNPIEFTGYADETAKGSVVTVSVAKAPAGLTIEAEDAFGTEYVSGAGEINEKTRVKVKMPDSADMWPEYKLPDEKEGFLTEIKLRVKDGDKTAYVYRIPIRVTEALTMDVSTRPKSLMDTSHWTVRAEVTNMRTGVPITGEVTLTEPSDWKQTKAFDTIPELSTGVVEFESGNVPRLNTKYVSYKVKTDQGDELEFAKSIDFSVAALRDKKDAPTIDGNLEDGEWYKATAMAADSEEQWYRIKSAKNSNWNGPDDLSGLIMLQCDEDNLYLGADVIDDEHSTPAVGEQIWRNDSIQFGIAFTVKDAQVFYGGDFTEIAISDTSEGPTVYRHVSEENRKPVGKVDTAKLAVKREGNHTYYELMIPWNEITAEPISADTLDRIGFSMLINDNDKGERKGAMTYGGGIVSLKDSGQFKFLNVIKAD